MGATHAALFAAASRHERLLMAAVMLEARATGVAEVMMEAVAARHRLICRGHFPAPGGPAAGVGAGAGAGSSSARALPGPTCPGGIGARPVVGPASLTSLDAVRASLGAAFLSVLSLRTV